MLKKASRLYAASWVRDIGPDLRPNDYKKVEENDAGNNVNKKEEPSTLEDLGLFSSCWLLRHLSGESFFAMYLIGHDAVYAKIFSAYSVSFYLL